MPDAVSDSSPLIHLAKILDKCGGQLTLLPKTIAGSFFLETHASTTLLSEAMRCG
jgi:hypothetical protein